MTKCFVEYKIHNAQLPDLNICGRFCIQVLNSGNQQTKGILFGKIVLHPSNRLCDTLYGHKYWAISILHLKGAMETHAM